MKLSVTHESWPIAGSFAISRGSKTTAEVIVISLEQDGIAGRGEGLPYPRYDETVAGAIASIEAARPAIEAGITRADVARLVYPRAARNALDCALWDLEAKTTGQAVWRLAGLEEPRPLVTAFTLSLGTPEAMGAAAARASARPLLKLKLGGPDDVARLKAVRASAPEARLIVDANEGWKPADLPHLLAVAAHLGVELIEQPLPAGGDEALLHLRDRPVPICADEAAHDVDGLDRLVGKYDAVNIKLDKTGGLTGALALARAAQDKGLTLMAGCMLATSLAMAPAMLIGQLCQVVDLDGPLLLARDRVPGIRYEGSLMYPPPRDLWG
jgi:L-alanine-DL-glutamate epimerase-like enolase superfamily enzyme